MSSSNSHHSLRHREIEYRALRVFERVAEGACGDGDDGATNRSEPGDPFIACFRAWPRPTCALARRLAAHANAARGRDVLWFIGVDPGAGKLPGVATPSRADDWISALQPWFDALMPRITPVEVPLPKSSTTHRPANGRVVVALHIETARAPFVFRAGAGRLETPWLDLNGTMPTQRHQPRSADRADLIRLLTPRLDLPSFELLEAQLTFYKNPHSSAYSRTTFRWSLDAALYVIPNSGNRETSRVVLPLHGCRGAVEIGGAFRSEAAEFNVTPDKASPAVRVTESAVLIDDLGRLFLYLCGATQHPNPPWQEPATLLLDLQPTGAERTATVMAKLRPDTPVESNQAGLWKL